MYNLIKQCNSGWSMTPFAAKLVSNKCCFYHDIFFATNTRVLWKDEKPVSLSILILRLLVTGDIGTSSSCSDSPLPTTECLWATPSVDSSWTK